MNIRNYLMNRQRGVEIMNNCDDPEYGDSNGLSVPVLKSRITKPPIETRENA